MKKRSVLILVTCIFAAFALGFFVGRNSNRGPVQVSVYQAPPRPAETAEQTGEPVYDLTVEAQETTEPQWPLNLNLATAAQLEALPGIGPALAGRIVDYRQTCGGFSSVEELLNVEGIGPKKLEGILAYVSIGGSN